MSESPPEYRTRNGEPFVAPTGYIPNTLEPHQSADRAGSDGSVKRGGRGDSSLTLRVAYADPPYPGMSGFYKEHPDYAGEVDHADLVNKLAGYDGWCLHTASTTLKYVLSLCPDNVRVMAWVKPFASFKKNVAVAYAWEPVIVKPCRMREYDGLTTVRDWCAESITLRRGLTGAKPEAVCRWLFEAMGMHPDDELHDLFPGTGAVQLAWKKWKEQQCLTAA